jgi:hypothetical protein
MEDFLQHYNKGHKMKDPVQVPVADDEEATVFWRKKVYALLPGRRTFGGHPKFKGSKQNPPYPDLYKTFEEMSPTAHWFWWRLNQHWDSETGIAKYLAQNKTEDNKKSKAYRQLKKLNLVHRVKRGEYLLNPSAAIPDPKSFEAVKKHWDYITL